MDKIISNALQFWYSEDHPLYNDPLPALMGIVGESGELCDLWKKKLYKPGYEFDRDAFIDELGDVLFYTAVLCHYLEIRIVDDALKAIWMRFPSDVLAAIKMINYNSACALSERDYSIRGIVKYIDFICDKFDITLDQLSELNYAKLNERAANGEGYNRGEEKERFVICNRADGCGIKCYHKTKHDKTTDDDDDECDEVGCFASGLKNATCIPYTDDECSE